MTVLLLVAMVIAVLRLVDQSDLHVAEVRKVKIKLNDAQFRAKTSEADEVIERDIRRDPHRTEAVYAHWEMSRGAMKLIGTMENLQKLDLTDATIKDSWLRYLEKLPLQTIDLAGSTISDAGTKHLAKIPTLRNLKVYDTAVSGKSIAILAPLKDLRMLQINGTKTTDEDILGLTAFPQLEDLDLSGTFITEESSKTFMNMDKLQSLELNHLAQTKASLERLKQMKSLRKLSLVGCDIDDEKAVILSQFPHVVFLSLGENPLTDKGLLALARLPLQGLKLADCKRITPAGVEKFRKANPACSLSLDRRKIAL